MLVSLTNTPRDYAWGSTTLLAEMEGREPSGRPEAEVWFGDHPGSPAVTADGRTLDRWLAEDGPAARAPERLPYLLKLLAAASPLSIQAHPSKTQAEAGFAREEDAGIDRDAPERTYRDANHKPELIVALSDEFRALAGLRSSEETSRLLAALGPAAAGLATRLAGPDASPAAAIAWVLSAEASADVRAIIDAARTAVAPGFESELALARQLGELYPGDPGIVVALLMNPITLRRGEGLFVPAGVLHAYLEGLGVELMAASDNVLRGGLTPKHIDVPDLLTVLDAGTGPVPLVEPRPEGEGLRRYDVPVADFALAAARPVPGTPVTVAVTGTAIAVATQGEVTVRGGAGAAEVTLAPGDAVLVTPDEGTLRIEGDGELFIAMPGA